MPDRAPKSADARGDVELAAIAGAHGVKGEVRLKLFGEGVEALRRYKRFNHGALTLVALRPDRRGAIARFAEIDNRAAAEKARGTVLSVPREALPALGEGEYYHADLIGLTAVTPDGEALGRCIAVHNFGASDIVEIEKHPVPAKGTKSFMVPMIDKAVIEWDEEKLVISPDFVEK